MSASQTNQAKIGRWLAWTPKARFLTDTATSEPTKPSKPGSVGFVGSLSGESQKIHAEPEPRGVLFAEWKATAINREFERCTGKPGNITAGTVRHGERNRTESAP